MKRLAIFFVLLPSTMCASSTKPLLPQTQQDIPPKLAAGLSNPAFMELTHPLASKTKPELRFQEEQELKAACLSAIKAGNAGKRITLPAPENTNQRTNRTPPYIALATAGTALAVYAYLCYFYPQAEPILY